MVAPLSLGEIWAWPSALKAALIENVRRLTDGMLAARESPPRAAVSRAARDRHRRTRCRRCPRGSTTPFVVELLTRMREFGPKAGVLRERARGARSQPSAERRGARSAPSSRPRRRSRSRSPTRSRASTSARARTGAAIRARVPGRADPPARPGGRLRPDGLREPRPLPARGRGDRRPTGEAQVAVSLSAIEQARGAHDRDAPTARRARRLPPDRQGPPRPGDAAAYRPGCASARARGVPSRARPPTSGSLACCPLSVRCWPLVARSQDASLPVQLAVFPARAAAGERARDGPRPAPHRGAGPAAPPRPAGPRDGLSPRTPNDGGDPDAAGERGGSARAGRAPRGAGTRQPRPARALRDPRRLPRLRAAETLPEDAAILEAARGRIEALNRRHGADGRSLLPVPPPPPLQPERELLDGLGAQARQARGVQPPAARRSRHQLRRHAAATWACCPSPLRDHARRRHAAAARRRALAGRHRGPSAQPPALRPARGPRDRGLRHPPAARQRDLRERGAARCSRASTPATPASTPTRPPSPTPTRTSSARASSPARACTTSTPSARRSRAACPRTRCCPTICSRACTRAPRS